MTALEWLVVIFCLFILGLYAKWKIGQVVRKRQMMKAEKARRYWKLQRGMRV